jgi:hypothetical protein
MPLLKPGLCNVHGFQALDAPVIHDFDRHALVLARLERQANGSAISLDQVRVDFRLQILRQARLAFIFAGHGENHLPGITAPAVIIGIQQPTAIFEVSPDSMVPLEVLK